MEPPQLPIIINCLEVVLLIEASLKEKKEWIEREISNNSFKMTVDQVVI